MLFNVAGTSAAGTMEDTDVETYQHLMNINYFGSVNITKAVLPHMKKQQLGAITFTSSAAGQIGLFGYTAYSPTKFALRGLAEALVMEVRPYNITVTVSYPPDTDTPGYKLENEPGKKPKETSLLEQSGGLHQPVDVARKIISAAVKGHDSVWFGLEGWMLNTLTAGMTPVTSLLDALAQVFLMSLLRLVSLFYLMDFDKIVRTCKDEREREKIKTR
jgi:3-dehydrosphinganine reductase